MSKWITLMVVAVILTVTSILSLSHNENNPTEASQAQKAGHQVETAQPVQKTSSHLAINPQTAPTQQDTSTTTTSNSSSSLQPRNHKTITLPDTPRSPAVGVFQNKALQAFIDPSHEQRVSASFIKDVPQVKHPEAMAAVIEVAYDTESTDNVRNEAFNLLRRSKALDLVDILTSIYENTNETERMRSYAIQHLGTQLTVSNNADEKEMITEVLWRAFKDPQIAVKREALWSLASNNNEQMKELVANGLNNPALINERDLVIRSMVHYNDRKQSEAVTALMTDADESLALAAINAVGLWEQIKSVEQLERLQKSPSARIRRAAGVALKRIYTPNPR